MSAADLVGRPGAGGPAPASRIVLALASHELRLTTGRGESLLVTFAIPVAVLAFFSAVDVLPARSGRAVDALLPGSIALAVVASCLVALSIATAYERSYGVLKRLAGTPATGGQRIAGKVVALLVVEVAQAALLVALAAALFGWAPGPGASIPLLVGGLALGTATFSAIGVLLAGTLRAETTLAIANGLFLVGLLLGDIVVPLDRLPEPLALLAGVLPVAALVDILRAGLGGAAVDVGGSAVVLVSWGLAGMLAALRWTRWD